jgi:hypothetical protein
MDSSDRFDTRKHGGSRPSSIFALDKIVLALGLGGVRYDGYVHASKKWNAFQMLRTKEETASFARSDPFLLEDQLTEGERAIRDGAAALAADKLGPPDRKGLS